MKHSIEPSRLHELLDLNPDTGALTWKSRTVADFADCKLPSRTCATWNGKHAGKPALNVDNQGYRQGWLLGAIVKAHHAVWAMTHGEWPTQPVDHINGDRGDNRPANLRLATWSQNSCNKQIGKPLKGIQRRPSGKWMARAKIGGVSTYLGQFDSAEEAAAAYDAAVQKMHGDYARPNRHSQSSSLT